MPYDLNAFIHFDDGNPNHSRVLIYPNQEMAARLLNHRKNKGAKVISIADCIPIEHNRLPMPNEVMETVDSIALQSQCACVVIGLDIYLSLLGTQNIQVFMNELRKRLDKNIQDIDYFLSYINQPNFLPRYEEGREIILIKGTEEHYEDFHVNAYHKKWAPPNALIGFSQLLTQFDPFNPAGRHDIFLPEAAFQQPGLAKNVEFISNIHDIAEQRYGINIQLDEPVLENLLLDSIKSGQTPELFLSGRFGDKYCNLEFALQHLLTLHDDALWPAYVWFLRRRLPQDSYMVKVLSREIRPETILRVYAVEETSAVMGDSNTPRYALERQIALGNVAKRRQIEPLIMEFIGTSRESRRALPFLNCGTFSEKIEIIRRSQVVDFSYGLPVPFCELYPALAAYMSPYDWNDETLAGYFQEYRRLKFLNSITKTFADKAYNTLVPSSIPKRDAVLSELNGTTDTALLIVDAMGVEYLPILNALAKRFGLNIEQSIITTANIPTSTEFNQIKWDATRTLPQIKGLDNIVHNGAIKNEETAPEFSLASTLHVIETEVFNRIADGLSRFSRIIVTSDHGSSRLAVIARQEGMGETLSWGQKQNEEPIDWRYSTALETARRPEECLTQYFPSSDTTYWVVRGYNRLPKKGGKKYAMHGGATLEEILVPVLVFSRNSVPCAVDEKQNRKKHTDDLEDKFEGII